jgi:hypothetical protein
VAGKTERVGDESLPASIWEKETTGTSASFAIVVKNPVDGKTVEFDGFIDGVLVDAKHWADWPKDELPFSQVKVVAQGRKQIEAAQGVPVVWKFRISLAAMQNLRLDI